MLTLKDRIMKGDYLVTFYLEDENNTVSYKVITEDEVFMMIENLEAKTGEGNYPSDKYTINKIGKCLLDLS